MLLNCSLSLSLSSLSVKTSRHQVSRSTRSLAHYKGCFFSYSTRANNHGHSFDLTALTTRWSLLEKGSTHRVNAPALSHVLSMHNGRRSHSSTKFSTKAETLVPMKLDDDSEKPTEKKYKHNAPIDKFLRRIKWSPDALERDETFNRWLMLPAAMATHLCLGAIYAWSVFSQPLTKINGVLAPASADWLLSDITLTFSLVMGGMAWGAVFSKYLDRLGPRVCGAIGSLSLFGGFGLASLAVELQSLPVLYLGGLVWGLANGWNYVPPVACLLRWFPERKGFAGGLCIVGFGGGAMISAPLFSKLTTYFRQVPEYLGPAESAQVVNQNGRLFTNLGDTLREVVIATENDILASGFGGLADPGVYLVGSGSTGVAESLGILGLIYGTTMGLCAMAFRLPKPGYVPPSVQNFEQIQEQKKVKKKKITKKERKKPVLTDHNVHTNVAMRTPQFWLLYLGFGTSITGAYGLLSCGKLLLTETFGSLDLITNSFTTSFVGAMSLANLSGRLFYSQLSDTLAQRSGTDPFFARRRTFNIMFSLAVPGYLGIVWSTKQGAGLGEILPLAIFTTSTFLVLTSFGGTTAARPALVGDLFGLKNLAPLQAIQLSVVLPAAYLGPKIVTMFREQAMHDSIIDLTSQVDDQAFSVAFGASKDNLDQLIDQKVLTISRIMELVPEGTVDPSPYMYDNAMYVMAGLNLIAIGANSFLKPVPKELHIKEREP